MPKALIIVESPTKAEKIQEYLGKDYIVMSSKGHITELAKGGKFGLGIDIGKDFKPHYVLMDSKINVLDALINAAKKCDNIILASDGDREGEAIAWHLSKRLEDVGKPIKRMVFNEIKKDKILKSLKNLRDVDMNLFHAQEARRILDRLVGFTASPFLMGIYGSNLSAGRVQSVVARMVIEREDEIKSFISEDFWNVYATLVEKNSNINFSVKYFKNLKNEKDAKEIYNHISSSLKYEVIEAITEDEKKYPSAPLVTSTLQQVMAKNHGFDADRTMKAAQSLYESGYCTYIRTDSVRASDESINELLEYFKNNNISYPSKPNIFKNKDSAQDAHECIRPSDINLNPYDNFAIIDKDEKLVYETIWKYFIASQMLHATFQTVKFTISPENDHNIKLKASGKCLKDKGYLEILGSSFDDKIDLPSLNNGDKLDLYNNSVKIEKKQTQPPARYTEDKLIKELVNKNIGRPATYADLLSKIILRKYVYKKGNVYHATDLGKDINSILVKYFSFMKYNYTSKMEEQLDKIETGKINHIEMLKNFYPDYKKELDAAYIDNGGSLCKLCSSAMVVKNSKKLQKKFLACSAWPKCNYTTDAE